MITRRLALSVPLSLTAALSLASHPKDSTSTTASATLTGPSDSPHRLVLTAGEAGATKSGAATFASAS